MQVSKHTAVTHNCCSHVALLQCCITVHNRLNAPEGALEPALDLLKPLRLQMDDLDACMGCMQGQGIVSSIEMGRDVK